VTTTWLRFNLFWIISNGCFSLKTLTHYNRDSVVGMPTTLRPEGSQVPTPAQGSLPSSSKVYTDLRAHPTSYSMGNGALSLAIRRSGREADHLHPSSAEAHHHVYTVTVHLRFTAAVLQEFAARCSSSAAKFLML
jgi:hypothetical protein